ncbi:hypothetical protein FSP39_015375 [Pinctada imbricata]|uniref:Arrestin-like N-terminal domain-containing protein n=1 Tax=Pinctada imbricata TaxID=66713 RepID=A0AA88YB69_PINIB|nr:hypothetical protein FSP39_015375 [Pinctada imbricata]
MANMNMKNVESFDIELATPSGIFYGGQQVAGKAVLVVESDLELTEILLTFQGYASTDWREMRGTGDNRKWKRYCGKETYFDFCESLVPKGQEPLILRPGRYEYPFSFDLPSDIPTSFESGAGHIRYRLQATIDRPSTIFDTSATCLISVLKPLDLNTNPDATANGQSVSTKDKDYVHTTRPMGNLCRLRTKTMYTQRGQWAICVDLGQRLCTQTNETNGQSVSTKDKDYVNKPTRPMGNLCRLRTKTM